MRTTRKRFKIVEQIIIVLLLAVIIPSVISGFIINNINQHSVRNQLQNSAVMMTDVVSKNIETFIKQNKNELKEIAFALKYIPNEYAKNVYLNDVLINLSEFKTLEIIHPSENGDFYYNDEKEFSYSPDIRTFILSEKINDDTYLVATIPLDKFDNYVFETFKNEKRQIYIVDKNNQLITGLNYLEQEFSQSIKALPRELKSQTTELYGGIKNQPLVYYKMEKPNVTIIVNTTHKVTNTTINTARAKIILSILVASFAILFLVGLYTYYLYINMRQLFKGIIALSKGNYRRKIRILTSVFTPYEVVFVASEFNKMVYEINVQYRKLKSQNIQLKELDSVRENLIDTVSHELRTPLTSIKGYTSRLLRQDIKIDEEMKNKSLKIIKNQTERLARMVDDLLVIPDIERSNLNIKLEKVDLNEVIENSIASIKDSEDKDIIVNISPDLKKVLADKDRLEQVFINLLENANKYGLENCEIKIEAVKSKNKAVISVINEAVFIPKEKLEKLVEKFMRIDDKTTRTTRGTGLGLFIVNGLVESMGGRFDLVSTFDNFFIAKIELNLK